MDWNAIASSYYPEEGDNALFCLLVAVADAYVRELENEASDDPSPYLGDTTPLDAAMSGLRENLEIRRGS